MASQHCGVMLEKQTLLEKLVSIRIVRHVLSKSQSSTREMKERQNATAAEDAATSSSLPLIKFDRDQSDRLPRTERDATKA